MGGVLYGNCTSLPSQASPNFQRYPQKCLTTSLVASLHLSAPFRSANIFYKVFLRGIEEACPSKRWKGASVSESALHTFDGDKPNSVAPRKRSRPDDHSSRLTFVNRPATAIRRSQTVTTVAVVRRYPRILSGRLPFLCFVLHRMGFFVPRESLRER